MTNFYGFQAGELVQFSNQPTLFGRLLRSTSGGGRLRVRVLVNGRYQTFEVKPTDLKSLTAQEAHDDCHPTTPASALAQAGEG